MALTSAEITRLLKPMADFAPAILRCAEIVAAAEEAERTIALSEGRIQAIQAEIDGLQEQAERNRATVKATQDEQMLATHNLEQAQAKLGVQITEAQQEWDRLKKAILSSQQEHAAALAVMAEEIRLQESILADRKRAVAQFKASLPE